MLERSGQFGILTLALASLLAIVFAPPAHAVAIDPSDANILYTGRWNTSNPSQPWAQAKGSSIIARFEGTSLAITLTSSGSVYYRVIVDGDAAGSSKQIIPSGVSTVLATGLVDSVHEIEIIKEVDTSRSTLIATGNRQNRGAAQ